MAELALPRMRPIHYHGMGAATETHRARDDDQAGLERDEGLNWKKLHLRAYRDPSSRINTLDYLAHVRIHVRPEFHQSATEIVQAGLARWCADEAVLGTFPIAGKQILAAPALHWKRVELGDPKFLLPFGERHLALGRFFDIAESVLRVDVVIA